jgi:hypothetical protein
MAAILAESGIRIVGRVTIRAQGLELLATILAKFGVRGILEGTVGTIHLSFRHICRSIFADLSTFIASGNFKLIGLFCSDVLGPQDPGCAGPDQEALNSSKSRFIVACWAGLC